MRIVGIAIDFWKLEIFRQCLTKAGYKSETKPGVTTDTLILQVEVADEAEVEKLREVVTEAERVAQRSRAH